MITKPFVHYSNSFKSTVRKSGKAGDCMSLVCVLASFNGKIIAQISPHQGTD